MRHCGSCHNDAESGYGSIWPEEWCCAYLHEERPDRGWLREDEVCSECESQNGAERRYVQQQAERAWVRWRPIVGTFEMCGTCHTWLGIEPYLGAGFVHHFEWEDYWAWTKAGHPHLSLTRSTRVPVAVDATAAALFGGELPTAAQPSFHVREVPHAWLP